MVNQVSFTLPQTPEFDKLPNIYYNKFNGKYWFEYISNEQIETNGKAWSKLISQTMVNYYTLVKNQGYAPEEHNEFINYLTTASFFLTLSDLNITLPV